MNIKLGQETVEVRNDGTIELTYKGPSGQWEYINMIPPLVSLEVPFLPSLPNCRPSAKITSVTKATPVGWHMRAKYLQRC
jgi:hypothetical protein